MIKREVGVFYPDVGLWTTEMHAEYYNLPEEEVKTKSTKKKKTRTTRRKKTK